MRFLECAMWLIDRLLSLLTTIARGTFGGMVQLRSMPVAGAMSIAMATSNLNAATWYVIGPGGNDGNLGNSWAQGLLTIQEGLDRANSGDQVWVKAGTYELLSTTDTYLLDTAGVWLLGGFAGTETLRTQAKPYINETILSGDIPNSSNFAYHVVTVFETLTDEENYTRIDGFIIENGDANGDTSQSPGARGGGLIAYGSTTGNYWLKVSRCRFRNNSAGRGGAVAAYRPSGTAAVYNVELTNCEFTDNDASNGGALWVLGCKTVINNSLFVHNDATGNGGAIALAQSCAGNPSNCEQRNCGLDNGTSSATVNNCTLTANHAGGEGGAAWIGRSEAWHTTGSIFWQNEDGSNESTERQQIRKEFDCEDDDGAEVTVS